MGVAWTMKMTTTTTTMMMSSRISNSSSSRGSACRLITIDVHAPNKILMIIRISFMHTSLARTVLTDFGTAM